MESIDLSICTDSKNANPLGTQGEFGAADEASHQLASSVAARSVGKRLSTRPDASPLAVEDDVSPTVNMFDGF